jgi:hypothetical protein
VDKQERKKTIINEGPQYSSFTDPNLQTGLKDKRFQRHRDTEKSTSPTPGGGF